VEEEGLDGLARVYGAGRRSSESGVSCRGGGSGPSGYSMRIVRDSSPPRLTSRERRRPRRLRRGPPGSPEDPRPRGRCARTRSAPAGSRAPSTPIRSRYSGRAGPRADRDARGAPRADRRARNRRDGRHPVHARVVAGRARGVRRGGPRRDAAGARDRGGLQPHLRPRRARRRPAPQSSGPGSASAPHVIPPLEVRRHAVSSSAVREHCGRATSPSPGACSADPGPCAGSSVRGAGRGRRLGFPTATSGPTARCLLATGVYAGYARPGWRRRAVNRARVATSASSMSGNRPTFGEDQYWVEAYLIDFSGDLYDRPISLRPRRANPRGTQVPGPRRTGQAGARRRRDRRRTSLTETFYFRLTPCYRKSVI